VKRIMVKVRYPGTADETRRAALRVAGHNPDAVIAYHGPLPDTDAVAVTVHRIASEHPAEVFEAVADAMWQHCQNIDAMWSEPPQRSMMCGDAVIVDVEDHGTVTLICGPCGWRRMVAPTEARMDIAADLAYDGHSVGLEWFCDRPGITTLREARRLATRTL
jgi:hypothetical protein